MHTHALKHAPTLGLHTCSNTAVRPVTGCYSTIMEVISSTCMVCINWIQMKQKHSSTLKSLSGSLLIETQRKQSCPCGEYWEDSHMTATQTHKHNTECETGISSESLSRCANISFTPLKYTLTFDYSQFSCLQSVKCENVCSRQIIMCQLMFLLLLQTNSIVIIL